MWWLLLLLILLLGCSETTEKSSETGLIINEIMVKNCDASGILAPNGKSADWIELYNMGSEPIALADYFLSDNREEPYRANLPTVTLAPGEYITLWCGGDANTGDNYLGFQLSGKSSSNECVLLSHRTKGLMDSCNYLQDSESLKKGRSYGRIPDGGRNWAKQEYPSPTAPNNG